MFLLGFLSGFVVAAVIGSYYSRKRAGVLLARAYRLGFLESKAGMPVRENVFPAITDDAYESTSTAAAGAAIERVIVTSATKS